MSQFIHLWSIKKRLYDGDAKAGARRTASFQKIESAVTKTVQDLKSQKVNWRKIAGYLRELEEREFETPYFRLSIAREIFEKPYLSISDKPQDRIKIAFEWTAREENFFCPSFCFEVGKRRNWKNPKLILISAEGKPTQLQRFAELIVRDFQNLVEINYPES